MTNNQLGKIIKKIRLSKKWTQKDLSAKTGFSQNTISNHENGNRTVGEKEVATYAKAFNISTKEIYSQLDDLFTEKDLRVTENFSNVVKERIEILQIQLDDVAKEINTSPKKIESILSGYIEEIAIGKLLKLCEFLNINPTLIYTTNVQEKTYEDYVKAKEMADFIESNFSSLSFKSKQSVYDYFVYELNKTNNDGD
ncbi:helix-turn-helix domain-containing protein [Mammaliicoccus sciuri]|uniref:helix-turn-helix domain-containing protein n=1 Tax=Mammaliicoccus sciuri TaxID=1296 RepID=UPI002DBEC1E7|nr:helix-turn-helix transcriptional regulator [Mammaliicoccus sciuri]MEB6122778.1 helix-turn-helix transcriptional regulator [Mammaliicoccus sciuri]MEB6313007.1 helix-turn-helix transcriptional regulator [Mammaliicoccus sciuri]MEB6696513.1 helix-turn-helix transcriptional regulator [Mammaliicoccus sciuri]